MSVATLKEELERERALLVLDGRPRWFANPYGLALDVIERAVRRHLPRGTRFHYGAAHVRVRSHHATGPWLDDLARPRKYPHFRRRPHGQPGKIRVFTRGYPRFASVTYSQLARAAEGGWLTDDEGIRP